MTVETNQGHIVIDHVDAMGVPHIGPLPELNILELRRVVTWAEHQAWKEEQGLPSEWDQEYWAITLVDEELLLDGNVCGTACCLAGKVVSNAGGQFLFDSDEETEDEQGRIWTYTARALINKGDHDEEEVLVEEFARDKLGLTPSEALYLFNDENDIAKVKQIAEKIAVSRGYTL